MKKTLLLAVFAMLSITAFAQNDSGFGIKGGLNYNGNGNYFESVGDAAQEPDRNIGYHAGIFGKIKISRLYIRPELIYTKTKSDYNGDSFDMSKLDLPVLVGVKVVGPLHVFAGPAFQYILNSEFDGISIDNIENDFSVGAHIGAGVNLGKLGIDLRYERGLSNNEAKFINTNIQDASVEGRLDTRPDQLILSLSLKL
ncbi:porin family protein [Maribacter sp. 2308TA10-17]|uniref:porin family protein n=1 Tax=Maribacter sp. 2308TA10-17 TaxID=3386276 RepID=UPI0039BC7EB4